MDGDLDAALSLAAVPRHLEIVALAEARLARKKLIESGLSDRGLSSAANVAAVALLMRMDPDVARRVFGLLRS